MSAPRVVIGIPLYNKADKLAETLESLLSQQLEDFHLVLVDDCSKDDTLAVAQSFAARDARVSVYSNERNLGLAGNCMKTWWIARERFPDAPYFAWGSDHDVWHPRWMKALVRALDENPAAVLAYPRNIRIGDENEVIECSAWVFDTRGITDPQVRFVRSCNRMSAGNMVYGLVRAAALARTGGLRKALLADRLFIAELALLGEFVQVPEILWYRRYGGLASLDRQRRSIFGKDRPLVARIPWMLHHAWLLFRHPVRQGGRLNWIWAAEALWLSLIYVALFTWREKKKATFEKWQRNARRKWSRKKVDITNKTIPKAREAYAKVRDLVAACCRMDR